MSDRQEVFEFLDGILRQMEDGDLTYGEVVEAVADYFGVDTGDLDRLPKRLGKEVRQAARRALRRADRQILDDDDYEQGDVIGLRWLLWRVLGD